MSNERPHHPYSPSTLQMREACAKYAPRSGTNVAAERGTAQHKAAELGKDDNNLSDDEAMQVAHCLDFIDARKHTMPGCTELREAYLPIDVEDTTAGYCDHILISADGTYAELVDWKMGQWKVTAAKENLQGQAYALGLFFLHPKIQRVKVFFVQPKLDWTTSHEFSRDDEPAMRLRVGVVVARAKEAAARPEDFSMANPTTKGCLFCGLLGKCPSVAAIALRVGQAFHPLAIPSSLTPTELHSSRDAVLGLQLSQVLAVWAKSYRAQITDRVIRSECDTPPGFVLVTKSDREVISPEKYKALALLHVTPEQYAASCNVVFGKIEGHIRDAAPRGSKKAALDSFAAELVDSGAVAKGDSYTFLKADSSKEAQA